MRGMAVCLALAVCLAACGDDSSGGTDGGGGGRTDGGGGGGTDSGGGGGSVQGSCDVMGAMHGCIDYAGFPGDPSQIESICTGQGGTYTAGAPCSHAGAVGGCRSMAAGAFTQTTWYYSGDVASLQMMCSVTHGTFLTP